MNSTKNFHIAGNVTLSNHSVCIHNSTIPIKVLCATMFLIFETVGNFLLYCMIMYEKYGMDSQKRTVSNQLISSICCSRILHNFTTIPIITVRLIFSHPFSKIIENISNQNPVQMNSNKALCIQQNSIFLLSLKKQLSNSDMISNQRPTTFSATIQRCHEIMH